MRFLFLLLGAAVILLVSSCNQQQGPAVEKQNNLVFRFEVDSAGNITSEAVKQQLMTLAKNINTNADKVLITAYSEQTGDKAKNTQIAFEMAHAAKKYMSQFADRAYYNIGVDIKGYDNPVNANNPTDLVNRRIEFTYTQ